MIEDPLLYDDSNTLDSLNNPFVNGIDTSSTSSTTSTNSVSGTSPTTNTTNAVTTDVITSSNAAKATSPFLNSSTPNLDRPSLFEILTIVSVASGANKSIQFAQSVDISRLSALLQSTNVDRANSLIDLVNQAIQAQADLTPVIDRINSQIDDLNQAIQDFNDASQDDAAQTQALHDAAAALNQAYAVYEASDKTVDDAGVLNDAKDAYNTVASAYSSYINNRNDKAIALNSEIQQFIQEQQQNNQDIETIYTNDVPGGDSDDFSDLLQPDYTGSLVTILPQAPDSIAPINPLPAVVANDPQTAVDSMDPQSVVTNTTDAYTATLLPTQTFMNNGLKQLQKLIEQKNYNVFYRPSLAGMPDAFASKLFGTDTGSASSTANTGSAGLGATFQATDPVVINRVFVDSNRAAQVTDFNNRLANPPFQASLLATQETLGLTSIASAINLLSAAGSNNIANNQDNLSSAIAILNSVNTTGLIGSLSPGDSSEQAFVNLSQLAGSLAILQDQLQIPDLASSILSLAGFSPSEVLNITGQGTSNSEYLTNPFSSALVAKNLSSFIANDAQLTSAQQQTVETALTTAASNSNSSNISQNVNSALVNAGLSQSQADLYTNQLNQPAFTSRVDFRDQLNDSLVQQGFSNQDASNIASTTAGVADSTTADPTFVAGSVDQNLLAQTLFYNLRKDKTINTPSDVATRVAQAFNQNVTEVNEATFREALQRELQNQGLNDTQSANIANTTALPLNPLANPTVQGVREDLVAAAQGTFAPLIGRQAAGQLAQNFANSLVGPANATAKDDYNESHQTLTSVINSNTQVVRNKENENNFLETVDLFHDFMARTKDNFVSIAAKLDPGTRVANTLSVQDVAGIAAGGKVNAGGTVNPLENGPV